MYSLVLADVTHGCVYANLQAPYRVHRTKVMKVSNRALSKRRANDSKNDDWGGDTGQRTENLNKTVFNWNTENAHDAPCTYPCNAPCPLSFETEYRCDTSWHLALGIMIKWKYALDSGLDRRLEDKNHLTPFSVALSIPNLTSEIHLSYHSSFQVGKLLEAVTIRMSLYHTVLLR